MRIVIVGASGAVGQAVDRALYEHHEIIRVSRNGAVAMDIRDPATIRAGFEKIGRFDALVSCAGKVHFGPFDTMQDAEYRVGLDDKLMGQVNLVTIGREFVADRGSFTLTSGVLSHDPIRFGSAASLVNGAIDAFVRAASIEMPRGIRLNAVSPGLLEESLGTFGPYFRGHIPVPAARVAQAYVKSVEGLLTGQIFHVL